MSTLSAIPASLPVSRRLLDFAERPALQVGGIGLVSLLIQRHLGPVSDVAWLITLAERVLDGQTPYVDFIEVNPPASILIYVPAVALARLIGMAPEAVTAMFGVAAGFACLALCAALLAPTRLGVAIGRGGLIFAALLLLALPLGVFDQRDHIALLAGLPFLALMAARIEGGRPARSLAALAGLGAGAMLAIRPHYALALAPVVLFFAARRGSRALGALWPELAAMALLVSAYGALVVFAYPAFLTSAMPLSLEVYVPVRYSLEVLLFSRGAAPTLVAFGCLALWPEKRWTDPLVAVPALAAAGAMAAYLVQMKGFVYHIYPPFVLVALAFGFAVAPALRQSRRAFVWLAAFAALEIAIACASPTSLVAYVSLFGAPLFAAVYIWVSRKEARSDVSRLAIAAVFVLQIAVMAAWFLDETPQYPGLETALARLGPHPTVMSASNNLSHGLPQTRKVGGRWVQRTYGTWISRHVDLQESAHPNDTALRDRLEPWRGFDHAMFVEDVRRFAPDVVLIAPNSNFLADPQIAEVLKPYHPFATDLALPPETALLAREQPAANGEAAQ